MGMEELFDAGLGGSERVDINLWIFPHLREFLAVDLRWDDPKVRIMDSTWPTATTTRCTGMTWRGTWWGRSVW